MTIYPYLDRNDRRPVRFYPDHDHLGQGIHPSEGVDALDLLITEPDESEQLSQALDLLRRIADMPVLLDSQFDGIRSEIQILNGRER